MSAFSQKLIASQQTDTAAERKLYEHSVMRQLIGYFARYSARYLLPR